MIIIVKLCENCADADRGPVGFDIEFSGENGMREQGWTRKSGTERIERGLLFRSPLPRLTFLQQTCKRLRDGVEIRDAGSVIPSEAEEGLNLVYCTGNRI